MRGERALPPEASSKPGSPRTNAMDRVELSFTGDGCKSNVSLWSADSLHFSEFDGRLATWLP